MKCALVFAAAFATAMSVSAQSMDLLITNGVIRTMDPRQPRAQAIAVLGNRIVAVGSDQDLRPLATAKTRVIDAKGRLILPGFNDAHVHFLSGGFQLSQVELRDADTPAEFTRRVREFAPKIKPGRWMTGGNWDHERWPGAPLPTKEILDAATTNVPVFVSRLDGHMALANTAALRLAG